MNHVKAVPIADYGFLVRRRGDGARRARRRRRLDVPAAPGLPERLRCAARAATRGASGSAPSDVSVPAARRYLPGTMVLETSWGTPTGWIIVRDVLLIGPWHHDDGVSPKHRRTPTDYDAEHTLLRTIRCVSGEVQMVHGVRAGARLRALGGDVDVCRPRLPRGPGAGRGVRRVADASPPTCGSASRAARRRRGRCSRRATRASSPCRGASTCRRRRRARRRTSGSSGRRTTGSTGSPAGASRTTRGAATSSEAR